MSSLPVLAVTGPATQEEEPDCRNCHRETHSTANGRRFI
jgi:hypothetical protein